MPELKKLHLSLKLSQALCTSFYSGHFFFPDTGTTGSANRKGKNKTGLHNKTIPSLSAQTKLRV